MSVAYFANARLRIALIRVTVAVARLADAQVETFDGPRVTNVAILARKSSITSGTSTLFDLDCTLSARVVLLGGVQRHEGKSENPYIVFLLCNFRLLLPTDVHIR